MKILFIVAHPDDEAYGPYGTIARKVLGTANSKWVEDITGIWSFLTLAGPRYAIRNAGEDLMVALAMGKSPWGLVKQKYTATRLNSPQIVNYLLMS